MGVFAQNLDQTLKDAYSKKCINKEGLMQDVNSRSEWWVLIVRGFAALLFGFAVLVWPSVTLGILVLLVALLVGALGVTDTVTGVRWLIKEKWNGFMWLVLGFVEVGVTVFLLQRVQSVAVLTFVLLVALAFVLRGLVAIVEAFDQKAATVTKWFSVVVGVLAVAAGVVVAVYPNRANLDFVWVFGLFALLTGAMETAIGLMAKENNGGRRR
jgi:uncharacterized membrane protein HdeD (DUF308 family)